MFHIRFKFTFTIYSFLKSLPVLLLPTFADFNAHDLQLSILQLCGSSKLVRLRGRSLCVAAMLSMGQAICDVTDTIVEQRHHPIHLGFSRVGIDYSLYFVCVYDFFGGVLLDRQ